MKKLKKSAGRKLLPQQSTIAKKLIQLAPNVTSGDRTNICRNLDISKATLSVYLNGKGPNNDLALDIINYASTYITRRERLISTLCEA